MKAPAVAIPRMQLYRGERVVMYDQVPQGNELAEYAVTVNEMIETWGGPELCPDNPTLTLWAFDWKTRTWGRGVSTSVDTVLGEELPSDKSARAGALIHAARIALWG